jgi:hypothetical protein
VSVRKHTQNSFLDQIVGIGGIALPAAGGSPQERQFLLDEPRDLLRVISAVDLRPAVGAAALR